MIWNLAILTPPPVELAHAPMIMSERIRNLQIEGQRSKSVVAKPVVVMMVDTWKKACLNVSSVPLYIPFSEKNMIAVATATTAR